MAKKDLMNQLKDEVKAYDENVELSVDVNGQEYLVKIWPFFKPEKVKDCADDISLFFINANKEKLNVNPKEEDDIITYFIIKHFTDIKMTQGKKTKTIYNEFKVVSNSSLFKVLSQSFPKESKQKIFEELYDQIDRNAELEQVVLKYRKQLKNLPLQNREVLGLDQIEQ